MLTGVAGMDAGAFHYKQRFRKTLTSKNLQEHLGDIVTSFSSSNAC